MIKLKSIQVWKYFFYHASKKVKKEMFWEKRKINSTIKIKD